MKLNFLISSSVLRNALDQIDFENEYIDDTELIGEEGRNRELALVVRNRGTVVFPIVIVLIADRETPDKYVADWGDLKKILKRVDERPIECRMNSGNLAVVFTF